MEAKNQPNQNTANAQQAATAVPKQAPVAAKPKENVFTEGINLIPEMTETEVKAGVYKRKFNLVALGILSVTAVLIGIIILVQLFLTFQANKIKSDTEKAKARVLENTEIEVKNLATKEKLDKINELLESAIPSSIFNTQLDKVVTTDPPIVVLSTALSPSGEGRIEGTASSSEAFKAFVKNLGSDEAKEHFEKVSVISFSGGPNSDGYKFSIVLSFTDRGLLTQE